MENRKQKPEGKGQMDLSMVEISVVLPTYNEEKNLVSMLPFLEKSLSSCVDSFEVIVVDGGSTDNTVNVSKNSGAKVIVLRDKGFGNAIKEGFKAAKGRFIITMDADNSHSPDFVRRMIKSRQDADLIIGSRFIKGSAFATNIWRKVLSSMLNKILKFILSLPINDSSSGFRIYRRNVLQDICIESKDFDVQLELLIKIITRGWRVKEIPLVYKKRLHGHSKSRVINCGLAFLKTLFKMYRLRNSILSGDYDDRALRSRLLPQSLWHKFKDKATFGYVDRGRFARLDSKHLREFTLDAGCGSAHFVQLFTNVIGLDIDIKKLRFLKLVKRIRNPLVLGNVEYLPFKDRIFEQIMFSEVIEHIPKSGRIFKEFCRVLKPSGKLIITTPNYSFFIWPLLEWIYGKIIPGGYADKHISRYNLKKLENALKNNGFKIINYKSFLKVILIIASQKINKSERSE